MNNNWALITGSSRGLGLEIAITMADAGFHTVITGRDTNSLSSAANKLKSVSNYEHQAVCTDLTEEGAPEKLYIKLKKLGIAPSVIVNNLGGGVTGDRRNIPIDILRLSLRLNLEVGIELNNLFYEDLKINSGVIVHIGSTASLHFDAPPGYVISKTALNAYVKNAARTFAKDNVCIFSVLPGMLEHEQSYINKLRYYDPERYQNILSKSIFGRFTTSSETARFILKIIEGRTPMINGALIQFDGGLE